MVKEDKSGVQAFATPDEFSERLEMLQVSVFNDIGSLGNNLVYVRLRLVHAKAKS